jgi:hypothetical protein
MDALTILSAAGSAITVLALALTGQGREMWSSTRSLVRRGAQPRLPARGAPGPLYVGDRSEFVRDVTLPDGSRVPIGRKLKKTWEIRNAGLVPWTARYLTRQGPHDDPRRLRSLRRIRVPETRPGGACRLSLTIETPLQPGSYTAEWKMTDAEGRHLFPNHDPLFVSLDATY